MNKTIGIIIAVAIIAILAGIAFSSMDKEANIENKAMEAESMLPEEMTEEAMVAGSYEKYSSEKVAMASEDKDVVLFFKAVWCPTCISLDKDIKANLSTIPENLTLLSVNYDNSSELKKKYGVTYQHTFVQVDKEGNLIKKWSGSPTLSKLVSEII